MLREHGLAVKALLDAEPLLRVFAEKVANLTKPPYVRLFVSVDRETGEGLCGTSDTAYFRVTTHSVGQDDEGAWMVTDLVRPRLLDIAPVVAGWSTSRMHHETGVEPRPDESTGGLVLDAIDVWTFMSTPT